MRRFRLALFCTALCALIASCAGKRVAEMPGASEVMPPEGFEGLRFTLKDGEERAGADTKAAELDPLDEAEIAKILARLEEDSGWMKGGVQGAEVSEFRFPESSKPRPKNIKEVEIELSAEEPGSPRPAEAAGPLEIVRFAPDGDVAIARNFSVTFNQPMVPVGSHQESVEASAIPVRISPAVKGNFRWVGARTLLFEPEVRFPMATDYRVTIDQGARSISGEALGEAAEFSFRTPAPKLVGALPSGGSIPLDPVMALVFDQKIDPEKALQSIRVEAGGRARSIRLADDLERGRSPGVSSLLAQLEQEGLSDRALVFIADEPLPEESAVTMRVLEGFPSAEGPKTTDAELRAEFHTFARLRVEGSSCAHSRCTPGSGLSIRFNNSLDPSAFDPLSVQIDPKPAFLEISAHGSMIMLNGATEGRTRYRVTLPADLRDIHGQTLGEEVKVDLETGDARPNFHAAGGLIVLDPEGERPVYDVMTVNVSALEVEVYRVRPEDYAAYINRHHRQSAQEKEKTIGERVMKQRVATRGEKDRLARSSIDLSEAMPGGIGHAIVRVRPVDWPDTYKPSSEAWVVRTKIGVDAIGSEDELLVFASDLRDGTGIEAVSIELVPEGRTLKTDALGIARIERARPKTGDESGWIIARKGDDSAILPVPGAYLHPSIRGADGRVTRELIVAHTFTDRGIYRPSETVSIKGILRVVDFGKRGDVEPKAELPRALKYRALDPIGNEIAEGEIPVNERGGFDLRIPLPAAPNHGYARVHFESAHASSPPAAITTGFSIQSFRTPSFEVAVEAEESSLTIGDVAKLKAKASYYAGGALGDSEVRWDLAISDAHFTPPKNEGFHFGKERRWFGPIRPISHSMIRPMFEQQRAAFIGRTSATGEHLLEMALEGVSPPFAKSVVASATVEDRDRQAHSSSAALLVHPSEAYLGLRAQKNFVERGDEFAIDAIAVSPTGEATPGLVIEVKARLHGMSGVLSEERCELRSGDSPVRCVFKADRGGAYEIVGDVRDESGRLSRTELRVWASGGPILFDTRGAQRIEEGEVMLIPERQKYSPGDRARVLIEAPFEGGEGVFTLRRSGLLEHQKVKLDGRSAVVEFDVLEEHLPGLHISVALSGKAPRGSEGDDAELGESPNEESETRPAYARGGMTLEVDTKGRALSVALSPEPRELAPRGETRVKAEVRDASGAPVEGAELTLLVVDEAILALIGHEHADPLPTFYPARQEGVSEARSRALIRLMRRESQDMTNDAVAETMAVGSLAAPMLSMRESAAGGSGGAEGSAIAVRADFRPLAFFGPELITDKDGAVSASVTLPDNLTRYRVVAIAADGARFGKAESSVVARLPLMLRASAPRFLNYGDRFELPLLVQNQTDRPIEAAIALRGTNLSFTGAHGSRVRIPANDRVEIRFPAEAMSAGTAAYEIAISAPGFEDAVRGTIPVHTPVTVEAFAHYGEIDGAGERVDFKRPKDAASAYGGLEISLSSTELASLKDTLLFFHRYPFAGTEQIASRLLSFAALRDILAAFDESQDELNGGAQNAALDRASYEARIEEDLAELKRRQRSDGGFDFWAGRDRVHPFVSVHVAHALIRARARGISVDEALYSRSLGFIRNIEEHLSSISSPDLRRAVIAYALYARALTGDRDIARAEALIKEGGGIPKTSLDTLGFLLPILHDGGDREMLRELERHLKNRITETASAANFIEGYRDGAHMIFASSWRTDGILLEALIRTNQMRDLTPKLVRGLLAHRSKGAMGGIGSTQENVFALLALDAYFRKHESATPDFAGRVWIGDRLAGEHRFRGRSAERASLNIPMDKLGEEGAITIAREGRGRLYYRAGMRYAPSDLRLGPANHGFAVERRYEAVDDPGDVRREADGSYRIKAGARVRVKLMMVAENRRYHVALVDPLAAGFEALNPALKTTEPPPPDEDPQRGPQLFRMAPTIWLWRATWYDHQNLRDEQAEAFSTLLPAGVHEYSYYIRATTPGEFLAPPPRASEMYAPETFGRGATDRVIIE